jgi:hypothetical protein
MLTPHYLSFLVIVFWRGVIDLQCCEHCHFIEIAYGWGPDHIWLHTTLEHPWPHYMVLEVCWDGLWTLAFGLSQFHGHGSSLVCEVALGTWMKPRWCNLRSDLGKSSAFSWVNYYRKRTNSFSVLGTGNIPTRETAIHWVLWCLGKYIDWEGENALNIFYSLLF